MRIVGVIPARYASTRFPGKPLALIQNKPMIQWVYERCSQAEILDEVIVATDDTRIFEAVCAFGGKVMMTNTDHRNGTERCAEVASKLTVKADYILNIQGDEPLIDPEQIRLLADLMVDRKAEIGTLVSPLIDEIELNSANAVKVVKSLAGKALYFSRQALPYQRDTEIANPDYFKHIGIYGFKADLLSELVQLAPTPLELSEQLEQLRWLENGYTIDAAVSEHINQGVDSPDDIQIILNILARDHK